MVNINWDIVPDAEDFSPVPAGEYPTKIVECTEEVPKSGNEFFKLKHEILEGEYKGKFVFDTLFFSEAALKRVKLVCSRIGIKTTGTTELEPKMFIGKKCIIDVIIESYDDDGKTKKSNKVSFAGYKPYATGAVAVIAEQSDEDNVSIDDDDEIPF